MFITLKLTSKRFIAVTAAAIIALLVIWLLRAAATEKGTLCENDAQRVEWLSGYGVFAEQTPLWVRKATVGVGGGWDKLFNRVSQNGFDLDGLYGKNVTVHCYSVTESAAGGYVWVISIRSRAIAYCISAQTEL